MEDIKIWQQVRYQKRTINLPETANFEYVKSSSLGKLSSFFTLFEDRIPARKKIPP